MRAHKLLFACLNVVSIVKAFHDIPKPSGIDTFTNATVYYSNKSSVSYTRTETLPGNVLLAAWTDFSSANNFMALYRSKDNGETWHPWGNCQSQNPGRRLIQPHLLYLNEDFGEEGKEVLLLAVNAVDNRSTNIEVYGSWDSGQSFKFVSRVAEGGRANTTNGATPVWEPFLLQYKDRIVVYYSDQRDPKHGQKLVQQTTQGSLNNWGPPADVIASSVYEDRPGMLVVTKLPNGQYFMVFEYAMVTNQTSGEYKYPIYYTLALDPEDAAKKPWHKLTVDVGTKPNGGPFATWSPIGGKNGTIVVSDSDHNAVWINQALGEGVWKELKTPHGRAYSREVRIPGNDISKLRIAGGAEYDATPPSQVEVSVMDLERALDADDAM